MKNITTFNISYYKEINKTWYVPCAIYRYMNICQALRIKDSTNKCVNCNIGPLMTFRENPTILPIKTYQHILLFNDFIN